jgi:hypothetical protein
MDLTKNKKPNKPILHKAGFDENDLVPAQAVYDKVDVPQASLEEEAELFVTRNRGLRLHIMVEHPQNPGYYMQSNVTFRDGKFRTSDQNLIAALKNYASFGGTHAKGFSDMPPNARASLYWAGNLPDELQKQDRIESEQLTRDRDQYEDPFRIRK